MDELNLYDDLDDFQEQQEKKSKELQEVEEKYQQALNTIEDLREENKTLKKNIQRIELGFQSLLDTARNEIKRKDKEIERLRKENDDICFRRKIPQITGEKQHLKHNPTVDNPFKSNTKDNECSLAKAATAKNTNDNEKIESYKRARYHDNERDHSNDYKRYRSNREEYNDKYPAKTNKKIEDDLKESRSHYREKEKDYTFRHNRNRSRERKDNDKPSSSKVHRKSPESPDRYFRRCDRSHSRERDNKYRHYEKNRSRERSPTRANARHTETKRGRGEKGYKTETEKSQKTYDKDIGKLKSEDLKEKEENKIISPSKMKLKTKHLEEGNVNKQLLTNNKNNIDLKNSNKPIQQEKTDRESTDTPKNVTIKNSNKLDQEQKTNASPTHKTIKPIDCEMQKDKFQKDCNKGSEKNNSNTYNKVYRDSKSDDEPNAVPKTVTIKQTVCETQKDKTYKNLNESEKMAEIENTTEILSQSSSCEPNKLCTPRKVALFNELFGESPSGSATSVTSSHSKNSFLNNIKGILAKSSPIAYISSATTSPGDYADISNGEPTPKEDDKIIEIISSANTTPDFNKDIIDNQPTPKRSEKKYNEGNDIDKYFIPTKISEENVKTIAYADLTDIVDNDIANEIEFVQIPGLDLCPSKKCKEVKYIKQNNLMNKEYQEENNDGICKEKTETIITTENLTAGSENSVIIELKSNKSDETYITNNKTELQINLTPENTETNLETLSETLSNEKSGINFTRNMNLHSDFAENKHSDMTMNNDSRSKKICKINENTNNLEFPDNDSVQDTVNDLPERKKKEETTDPVENANARSSKHLELQKIFTDISLDEIVIIETVNSGTILTLKNPYNENNKTQTEKSYSENELSVFKCCKDDEKANINKTTKSSNNKSHTKSEILETSVKSKIPDENYSNLQKREEKETLLEDGNIAEKQAEDNFTTTIANSVDEPYKSKNAEQDLKDKTSPTNLENNKTVVIEKELALNSIFERSIDANIIVENCEQSVPIVANEVIPRKKHIRTSSSYLLDTADNAKIVKTDIPENSLDNKKQHFSESEANDERNINQTDEVIPIEEQINEVSLKTSEANIPEKSVNKKQNFSEYKADADEVIPSEEQILSSSSSHIDNADNAKISEGDIPEKQNFSESKADYEGNFIEKESMNEDKLDEIEIAGKEIQTEAPCQGLFKVLPNEGQNLSLKREEIKSSSLTEKQSNLCNTIEATDLTEKPIDNNQSAENVCTSKDIIEETEKKSTTAEIIDSVTLEYLKKSKENYTEHIEESFTKEFSKDSKNEEKILETSDSTISEVNSSGGADIRISNNSNIELYTENPSKSTVNTNNGGTDKAYSVLRKETKSNEGKVNKIDSEAKTLLKSLTKDFKNKTVTLELVLKAKTNESDEKTSLAVEMKKDRTKDSSNSISTMESCDLSPFKSGKDKIAAEITDLQSNENTRHNINKETENETQVFETENKIHVLETSLNTSKDARDGTQDLNNTAIESESHVEKVSDSEIGKPKVQSNDSPNPKASLANNPDKTLEEQQGDSLIGTLNLPSNDSAIPEGGLANNPSKTPKEQKKDSRIDTPNMESNDSPIPEAGNVAGGASSSIEESPIKELENKRISNYNVDTNDSLFLEASSLNNHPQEQLNNDNNAEMPKLCEESSKSTFDITNKDDNITDKECSPTKELENKRISNYNAVINDSQITKANLSNNPLGEQQNDSRHGTKTLQSNDSTIPEESLAINPARAPEEQLNSDNIVEMKSFITKTLQEPSKSTYNVTNKDVNVADEVISSDVTEKSPTKELENKDINNDNAVTEDPLKIPLNNAIDSKEPCNINSKLEENNKFHIAETEIIDPHQNVVEKPILKPKFTSLQSLASKVIYPMASCNSEALLEKNESIDFVFKENEIFETESLSEETILDASALSINKRKKLQKDIFEKTDKNIEISKPTTNTNDSQLIAGKHNKETSVQSNKSNILEHSKVEWENVHETGNQQPFIDCTDAATEQTDCIDKIRFDCSLEANSKLNEQNTSKRYNQSNTNDSEQSNSLAQISADSFENTEKTQIDINSKPTESTQVLDSEAKQRERTREINKENVIIEPINKKKTRYQNEDAINSNQGITKISIDITSSVEKTTNVKDPKEFDKLEDTSLSKEITMEAEVKTGTEFEIKGNETINTSEINKDLQMIGIPFKEGVNEKSQVGAPNPAATNTKISIDLQSPKKIRSINHNLEFVQPPKVSEKFDKGLEINIFSNLTQKNLDTLQQQIKNNEYIRSSEKSNKECSLGKPKEINYSKNKHINVPSKAKLPVGSKLLNVINTISFRRSKNLVDDQNAVISYKSKEDCVINTDSRDPMISANSLHYFRAQQVGEVAAKETSTQKQSTKEKNERDKDQIKVSNSNSKNVTDNAPKECASFVEISPRCKPQAEHTAITDDTNVLTQHCGESSLPNILNVGHTKHMATTDFIPKLYTPNYLLKKVITKEINIEGEIVEVVRLQMPKGSNIMLLNKPQQSVDNFDISKQTTGVSGVVPTANQIQSIANPLEVCEITGSNMTKQNTRIIGVESEAFKKQAEFNPLETVCQSQITGVSEVLSTAVKMQAEVIPLEVCQITGNDIFKQTAGIAGVESTAYKKQVVLTPLEGVCQSPKKCITKQNTGISGTLDKQQNKLKPLKVCKVSEAESIVSKKGDELIPSEVCNNSEAESTVSKKYFELFPLEVCGKDFTKQTTEVSGAKSIADKKQPELIRSEVCKVFEAESIDNKKWDELTPLAMCQIAEEAIKKHAAEVSSVVSSVDKKRIEITPLEESTANKQTAELIPLEVCQSTRKELKELPKEVVEFQTSKKLQTAQYNLNVNSKIVPERNNFPIITSTLPETYITHVVLPSISTNSPTANRKDDKLTPSISCETTRKDLEELPRKVVEFQTSKTLKSPQIDLNLKSKLVVEKNSIPTVTSTLPEAYNTPVALPTISTNSSTSSKKDSCQTARKELEELPREVMEFQTPKKLQSPQNDLNINSTIVPERNTISTITSTLPETYSTHVMLPSISTNSPTPPNFSGIFSKKSSSSIIPEEDTIKFRKKSPHFKPREYVLPAASVLCNVDNLENATKVSKKLHWELLDNKNEMTEIEDDADIDTTDEEPPKIKEEPIDNASTSPQQPNLQYQPTRRKSQKSSPSETDTQTEDESLLRDIRQQAGTYRQSNIIPTKIHKLKHRKHKLCKTVKDRLKAISRSSTVTFDNSALMTQMPFSIVFPKRPVGRPRKLPDSVKKNKMEITKQHKKRGRKPKIKPQEEIAVKNIILEGKLDKSKEIPLETIEDNCQKNSCETNVLEYLKVKSKDISCEKYKPIQEQTISNSSEKNSNNKYIENTVKILSTSVERLEICDEPCTSKDSAKQRNFFDKQIEVFKYEDDNCTSMIHHKHDFSTDDINPSLECNQNLENKKAKESLREKQIFVGNNIVSSQIDSLENPQESFKETHDNSLISRKNSEADKASSDKTDIAIEKLNYIESNKTSSNSDPVVKQQELPSSSGVNQENTLSQQSDSETDKVSSEEHSQDSRKEKSLKCRRLKKPLMKKKLKSKIKNKVTSFISLEDIGIKVRPLKVHLSTFRIPNIKKDAEEIIGNSWKLETYIELEKEGEKVLDKEKTEDNIESEYSHTSKKKNETEEDSDNKNIKESVINKNDEDQDKQQSPIENFSKETDRQQGKQQSPINDLSKDTDRQQDKQQSPIKNFSKGTEKAEKSIEYNNIEQFKKESNKKVTQDLLKNNTQCKDQTETPSNYVINFDNKTKTGKRKLFSPDMYDERVIENNVDTQTDNICLETFKEQCQYLSPVKLRRKSLHLTSKIAKTSCSAINSDSEKASSSNNYTKLRKKSVNMHRRILDSSSDEDDDNDKEKNKGKQSSNEFNTKTKSSIPQHDLYTTSVKEQNLSNASDMKETKKSLLVRRKSMYVERTPLVMKESNEIEVIEPSIPSRRKSMYVEKPPLLTYEMEETETNKDIVDTKLSLEQQIVKDNLNLTENIDKEQPEPKVIKSFKMCKKSMYVESSTIKMVSPEKVNNTDESNNLLTQNSFQQISTNTPNHYSKLQTINDGNQNIESPQLCKTLEETSDKVSQSTKPIVSFKMRRKSMYLERNSLNKEEDKKVPVEFNKSKNDSGKQMDISVNKNDNSQHMKPTSYSSGKQNQPKTIELRRKSSSLNHNLGSCGEEQNSLNCSESKQKLEKKSEDTKLDSIKMRRKSTNQKEVTDTISKNKQVVKPDAKDINNSKLGIKKYTEDPRLNSNKQMDTGSDSSILLTNQRPIKMRSKSTYQEQITDLNEDNENPLNNQEVESKFKHKLEEKLKETKPIIDSKLQTHTDADSSTMLTHQRPIKMRRKSTYQEQIIVSNEHNGNSLNEMEAENKSKQKLDEKLAETKPNIERKLPTDPGLDSSIKHIQQNQTKMCSKSTNQRQLDINTLNDEEESYKSKQIIEKRREDKIFESSQQKDPGSDSSAVLNQHAIKLRKKSTNQLKLSGSNIGDNEKIKMDEQPSNKLTQELKKKAGGDSDSSSSDLITREKSIKTRIKSTNQRLILDAAKEEKKHNLEKNCDIIQPVSSSPMVVQQEQTTNTLRKLTNVRSSSDSSNNQDKNNTMELNKTKLRAEKRSENSRPDCDVVVPLPQQEVIKIHRKSLYQQNEDPSSTSTNTLNNQETKNNTTESNKSEQKLQQETEDTDINVNNIQHNEPDSDSSIVLTQQKSIKIRRKSTNQLRILDTSSDDDEPLIKKPTVISNEIKTPLTKVTKTRQRRKRVVKVLSTSLESPTIVSNDTTIPQSSRPASPLTSPTLNHPIFNTEVSTQSTEFAASMPMTPNQQDDNKFKEIDSKLHAIFQSPQYTVDYKISPAVDASNLAILPPPTLSNSKSNVTIDETQDLNQENNQSSLNISQLNESSSCLNDSASTHNNSEVKHLSLGSAEYRFEKVSDNVINLFISRKRKRKRNN